MELQSDCMWAAHGVQHLHGLFCLVGHQSSMTLGPSQKLSYRQYV
jgi:hypothetical protein